MGFSFRLNLTRGEYQKQIKCIRAIGALDTQKRVRKTIKCIIQCVISSTLHYSRICSGVDIEQHVLWFTCSLFCSILHSDAHRIGKLRSESLESFSFSSVPLSVEPEPNIFHRIIARSLSDINGKQYADFVGINSETINHFLRACVCVCKLQISILPTRINAPQEIHRQKINTIIVSARNRVSLQINGITFSKQQLHMIFH